MRAKKKSKLTNGFSRQIDEHFHRVSFREIKILWSILRNLSLKREEFVRRKFLQDAIHYSDIVDFLKNIRFLRVAKGQLSLEENLGGDDEELKSALIHRLLQGGNVYWQHLNSFFGFFEIKQDTFQIQMDTELRRRFGGARNLLLELEFLERDFKTTRYWIAATYLPIFVEARIAAPTTPAKLQIALNAREELGHKAELAILKFEAERLRSRPDLVKRIRHVALENVSAGFDIASFSVSSNRASFSERLIEVKAVSPCDFRFCWSRNEIETAQTQSKDYFLYLLPVSRTGFDINKLRIIQNPFEAVYLDRKSWFRQDELISFWPK